MTKSELLKLYQQGKQQTDRNSRILIVDFMNTFIRVWSAVPVLNDEGYHVGGITGFLYTLGAQIRNMNITKVYIVLDGQDGNSSKRKIYSGYKGNRNSKVSINRSYGDNENAEQSFKRQMLRVVEYLSYLPVTIVQVDRCEADDVMHYITHLHEDDDNQVIISSADKDFLQLVSDKISVYSPTKKKLYQRQDVIDEWEVIPENLAIMRSVLGDKSDNLDGVKGIGKKTFVKNFGHLIKENTTFEEFVENLQEVEDKKKKKLVEQFDVFKRNYNLMKLREETLNGRQKGLVRDTIDRYKHKDIQYLDFLRLCREDRIFEIMKNPQGWLQKNIVRLIEHG